MASDTNTNSDIDEEALADDVDKHVSQRCPGQSAPAKSTPYPSAPPSNETHYLVIPPDVYRRSPEPGEQNHTHWITLRADADTRQTTPPDQYDKDGRILRLPYNIFDEQVGGLNRWGELGNDDAASLLMARSLLEVWVRLAPTLSRLLKTAPGGHGSFESGVRLEFTRFITMDCAR